MPGLRFAGRSSKASDEEKDEEGDESDDDDWAKARLPQAWGSGARTSAGRGRNCNSVNTGEKEQDAKETLTISKSERWRLGIPAGMQLTRSGLVRFAAWRSEERRLAMGLDGAEGGEEIG